MTDCRTRYPILLVHGLNCRDEVPFFYWGRVPELLAGAFVVITYLKRRSLLFLRKRKKPPAKRSTKTKKHKPNICEHCGGAVCVTAMFSP